MHMIHQNVLQPESRISWENQQIHGAFWTYLWSMFGFISTFVPRRLSIQFWYDDCLGSPPIQEAPTLVGTKLRQHELVGMGSSEIPQNVEKQVAL